jgi:hypothetical protein
MDKLILSFFGGTAIGAIFSGILKIVADAIKDRRVSRTEHEATLRAAYEEWSRCIEDARGAATSYAILSTDEKPEDAVRRQRRALLIQQKLGAARARVVLLEDDEALRREAHSLASRFAKAALGASTASSPADILGGVQKVKDLRREFYSFLMKVASQRSYARNRPWLSPSRLREPFRRDGVSVREGSTDEAE